MLTFAKLTKLLDILILICVIVLSLAAVVAGVIEVASIFGISIPEFAGREVVIGLAQPFFYYPQLIFMIHLNLFFSPVYLALGVAAVIFVGSFLALIFAFRKRCGRIGYIIKAAFRMIWGVVAAFGIYVNAFALNDGVGYSLAVCLPLFTVALFNLALAFQPGELASKSVSEKVPVIVQVVGNNSASSDEAASSSSKGAS